MNMWLDLSFLWQADIEWQWVWAFGLLPLPWLVRIWFKPTGAVSGGALIVPFWDRLNALDSGAVAKRSKGHWLKGLWLWMVWCLLVIACARPVSIGEAVALPREGRSLMLAVDISKSMLRKDMQLEGRRVARITAVKAVLKTFLEQRTGDKIGLVLFGSQAFLQSPLTFDVDTLQTFIDETHVGLAGDQTAIGDGLGLVVKQLEKSQGEKVLILLSDGDNTAGSVKPEKAAAFAEKESIKVYTIAFGRDFFGRAIHSKTLNAIADITQGQSFSANNTKDLTAIYQVIDQLEKIDEDQDFYRPRTEEYFRLMRVALGLFVLGWLMLGLLRLVRRLANG